MVIKTMPEGFKPRRQGKRPIYDITELAEAAKHNAGSWVAVELPAKEARSAKGQLDKAGYEVSVELDHTRKGDANEATVYTKWEN